MAEVFISHCLDRFVAHIIGEHNWMWSIYIVWLAQTSRYTPRCIPVCLIVFIGGSTESRGPRIISIWIPARRPAILTYVLLRFPQSLHKFSDITSKYTTTAFFHVIFQTSFTQSPYHFHYISHAVKVKTKKQRCRATPCRRQGGEEE
jgi:hypothetical protein